MESQLALLKHLAQNEDLGVPVLALPENLLNPDLLYASDSDGLIEFRREAFGEDHRGEIVSLGRWQQPFSMVSPNKKPMCIAIEEWRNEDDSGFPVYVRLSNEGRVAVARSKLQPNISMAIPDKRRAKRSK
jgi:hypothetical protein